MVLSEPVQRMGELNNGNPKEKTGGWEETGKGSVEDSDLDYVGEILILPFV